MTENDEWEHSALFYVVDALDHICEKLGLVKLSSFLDWTDFEINIAMQEIARTNQNPKDEWRRFRYKKKKQTLCGGRRRPATHLLGFMS
jgi:hypothetical protein